MRGTTSTPNFRHCKILEITISKKERNQKTPKLSSTKRDRYRSETMKADKRDGDQYTEGDSAILKERRKRKNSNNYEGKILE